MAQEGRDFLVSAQGHPSVPQIFPGLLDCLVLEFRVAGAKSVLTGPQRLHLEQPDFLYSGLRNPGLSGFPLFLWVEKQSRLKKPASCGVQR